MIDKGACVLVCGCVGGDKTTFVYLYTRLENKSYSGYVFTMRPADGEVVNFKVL